MKNFVKIMNMEDSRFAFLLKFSQISIEKLKAGIFDGPQIREPMKDPMFDKALSKAELFAWQSLKLVVTNFLGNHQRMEYKKEIEELLKSFCELGACMSVKLLFLHSHLDHFLKNCRDLCEDQGEHFHIIEVRYQGQWDVNFLADYCWCLKRDSVAAEYRRKSYFGTM